MFSYPGPVTEALVHMSTFALEQITLFFYKLIWSGSHLVVEIENKNIYITSTLLLLLPLSKNNFLFQILNLKTTKKYKCNQEKKGFILTTEYWNHLILYICFYICMYIYKYYRNRGWGAPNPLFLYIKYAKLLTIYTISGCIMYKR